ncbi:MAG TPA: hypothetical protein VHM90_07665 [Phycisphaerae bacterium]|nr:hypothetical protein [Phycisphaerae bacterium]
MAAAYYIWIMAAFFISCVGLMALLVGLFWIGHWVEKKQTGAKHGFLEIPPGSEARPAPKSEDVSNT